jgi:hypothetical protein
VYDALYKQVDLAARTTAPDAIIDGWTPANNLYRNVVALLLPDTPLGDLTALVSVGRNAEDPFSVLVRVLNPLIPPVFVPVALTPAVEDFAYVHRGIVVGLSVVFIPYGDDRFLRALPSGELDPPFVTSAQQLDTSGLGLSDTPDKLLMSQGAAIPGTTSILATCWYDEAPLLGALVHVDAVTGTPTFVRGGTLRIYNAERQVVVTRTFGETDIVRLVSDPTTEVVQLASAPSSAPLTSLQPHREAVYDPSSGAVVFVPASDRHVYLVFYNPATGTAEVERHPVTGMGQLERRWKWGAAVYVPERQAVVCAPANHSHVLEISGAGSSFATRSLLKFPDAPSPTSVLFSDIVYASGTLHLMPREISTSRIITLPADFDEAEPYLLTL